MKATLVKLIPEGNRKFHFGYRSLEINDVIFHSDSLFSAICNNYVRIYGQDGIDDFIKNFPIISSVFFGYKNNGKEILFVPRPLSMKLPRELIKKDRKLAKKVKFVSFYLLDKNLEEIATLKSNNRLLYCETADDIELFRDRVDEKVPINRETGVSAEGGLYSVSSIFLHENAFMYFLVLSTDEKTKECIKSIEHFGIGGEITSGYGQVTVEIAENAIEIPDGGNKMINLSIVFPKEGENIKVEKWELIERRGYIYGTTSLRKTCIGIKEGSVFTGRVEGSVLDVSSNDQRSFRYGKAFLVPSRDDSYGE